ncbi:15009_t:CDS:2 [Entrophospora sp. SA101]|nr:15009_t:CDS:2 [Entrophospora sp. SA101]
MALIFTAKSPPSSLLHALSKHSTGLILLYNLLWIIVNCLAISKGSKYKNLTRFRLLGRIGGGGGAEKVCINSLNVATSWVMELRERGFQYPMTEISGFIAKKWQEETPERKNAYVKIAMEAKTLHKQKFGDKIKYNNNNDFTSASSQPKKTIKKKSKFSQFKQPMVSLHNHTTIPSSSLILPTPGTTPTLPTPIASPILPPSSSYIDDNYFNEFINIDNNTTITSNNNNEENLPCVCDSPSTVHSSSENGDLEEIDPDLFTFLI